MHKNLLAVVVLCAAIAGGWTLGRNASEAGAKGTMLSHDVYFTLKDKKDVNKLVSACNKYLTSHPGEVFYAAGPRTQDLKREVNDTDFDVGLHIVFRDKASHDKYQDAPRHLSFIEENKHLWAKVRVFDTDVPR